LLLGSVASKVVTYATCPVLVTKWHTLLKWNR
jgi:nucleotide-binding universal stress UspA family protein